jgi:26S proteasome regulatory subunit T6
MTIAVQAPTPVGGIKSYYQTKIEAAELLINQKTQNLRRLEAQRNALNARGVSSVSSSVLKALSPRFYCDI